MKVKGLCKDCLFLKQEYALTWDKDFNQSIVLDTYCGLCDIFKSSEGYCDCWEEK